MTRFILDTVVLRVFAFAHPKGIDILLGALNTSQAAFPSEVYDLDEETLPLNAPDQILSELARGLRFARCKVQSEPRHKGQRYQAWLENATQIPRYIQTGNLLVEPLELEEIPRREKLSKDYGIGRGEAACLTLAERHTGMAIFLSNDEKACQVAQTIGISFLTIPDILAEWIRREHPARELFQELIAGMERASFAIPNAVHQDLQQLLE